MLRALCMDLRGSETFLNGHSAYDLLEWATPLTFVSFIPAIFWASLRPAGLPQDVQHCQQALRPLCVQWVIHECATRSSTQDCSAHDAGVQQTMEMVFVKV